jgi:glyoxylase-like metal-dependent hydrolase (beta-lactamase superfamily II)
MALTVPLAKNVWRVPLLGSWVNGFLFRDDEGVTMLDMGVSISGRRMIRALESIGAAPEDVTRLLLTHCHPDHAGGAAYVAERTGKAVDLHADDADFLRDGVRPPRDPAYSKPLFRWRRGEPGPSKGPKAPVGEELTDGQVIPVAGGLQVVHTPGHSPGHVSYLHRDSGVLITGDAIFNVLGVRWPVKSFCTDFAMTKETAGTLVDLEYAVAAFTHGPEITDQPREKIAQFLHSEGFTRGL